MITAFICRLPGRYHRLAALLSIIPTNYRREGSVSNRTWPDTLASIRHKIYELCGISFCSSFPGRLAHRLRRCNRWLGDLNATQDVSVYTFLAFAGSVQRHLHAGR